MTFSAFFHHLHRFGFAAFLNVMCSQLVVGIDIAISLASTMVCMIFRLQPGGRCCCKPWHSPSLA